MPRVARSHLTDDPTIYENLAALLEGARRSSILRWVMRGAMESGRDNNHDRQ